MTEERPARDRGADSRARRARRETLFRIMDEVVREFDRHSVEGIGRTYKAAREAALFAEQEGWVQGPLWQSEGATWLRLAWLHHHGESLDEWSEAFEWYRSEMLRRFKEHMANREEEEEQ